VPLLCSGPANSPLARFHKLLALRDQYVQRNISSGMSLEHSPVNARSPQGLKRALVPNFAAC